MPAASRYKDDRIVRMRYWQGIPIGFIKEGKSYVYNHVNIEIDYHPVEAERTSFV
jgi:hypothetical protein